MSGLSSPLIIILLLISAYHLLPSLAAAHQSRTNFFISETLSASFQEPTSQHQPQMSATAAIADNQNPVIPASAQDVIANPWPLQFSINFTTNSGAALGWLAYDWLNKQQLIAHGAGSTECARYPTRGACSLLFNSVGTYAILPTEQKCWLDIPGVGSVPPDWTTGGVYVDTRTVEGVGACRAFEFPPTPHVYLETVSDGLPCGFVFPDPSMSYVFLPHSLIIGNPGSQNFQLPEYCAEEKATA